MSTRVCNMCDLLIKLKFKLYMNVSIAEVIDCMKITLDGGRGREGKGNIYNFFFFFFREGSLDFLLV